MKKLLLLVLIFTAVTITVCMISESILSTATKIIVLVIEAVVFQLSVMDLSFLNRERRAALKNVIEDYPPNNFKS